MTTSPRPSGSRRGPAAHGRTLHEVALSYLASNPVTASVIAGASAPEQVTANAAATRTDLTDEERAEIAAAVAG